MDTRYLIGARLEGARNPQGDRLLAGLDPPRGTHHVLRCDGCQHGPAVEPHPRYARRIESEEDPLVLRARRLDPCGCRSISNKVLRWSRASSAFHQRCRRNACCCITQNGCSSMLHRLLATEASLLKFLIFVTLAVSSAGILIGVITTSFSITFDGFYSLIDAMMSLISLVVVSFIKSHSLSTVEDKRLQQRFSYGFWHLEPIVLGLNGILLSGVIAVSQLGRRAWS